VQPVRDAGIVVDLAIGFDPSLVPAYASVSAYRIVQEALTNTVRHAGASRVRVELTVRDQTLYIEVIDDGSSDEAPIVGAAEGHGLRGMSERIGALGGTFSAGPMAEGGFCVTASIPLTRSA
jgi:signal transduction histidine kinase